MDTALYAALDALSSSGVHYGEVRRMDRERIWNGVRNTQIEMATHSVDGGVGFRVWHDGAWGCAATQEKTADALIRTALRAAAIAKAGKAVARPSIEFPPTLPQKGTYRTPIVKNAFEMTTKERFEALFAITDSLRSHSEIISAKAVAVALRMESHLLTTLGTDIQQEIFVTGGGMQATAGNAHDVQTRSYPKDFEGNVRGGGWEVWESFDLLGHSERVREEARELLHAPTCPSGEFTVILANSQLSLHVHETCGHPTELDRALGDEISLAGASFLTTDRRENYQYGSPLVNLTADATTPGGAGTFGWDDEGTPASRTPLIQEGAFVNYLSNRESASRIGIQSSGAARANSWSAVPIVRMVNVNLEAGHGSLADLIADTPSGLFIETNKSWSIDDLRLNFQFGCESARKIENGRLSTRYKNPVYTGITPTFWAGCDAICGPEEWEMWGYLFCGKGDPMQSIHVGHGVSPARFQNVQVGATS